MAEIFPAAFQDFFSTRGFSYVKGETASRTQMDVGLDKVRSRYTKGIDNVKGQFRITKSQFGLLDTFFVTTLNNGTKTFLYDHPLSGDTDLEWRFKGSYTITPLGGEYLIVAFTWELIP